MRRALSLPLIGAGCALVVVAWLPQHEPLAAPPARTFEQPATPLHAVAALPAYRAPVRRPHPAPVHPAPVHRAATPAPVVTAVATAAAVPTAVATVTAVPTAVPTVPAPAVIPAPVHRAHPAPIFDSSGGFDSSG